LKEKILVKNKEELIEIINKCTNDANLNYLDVSLITNMDNLFNVGDIGTSSRVSAFNGDISKWNKTEVFGTEEDDFNKIFTYNPYLLEGSYYKEYLKKSDSDHKKYLEYKKEGVGFVARQIEKQVDLVFQLNKDILLNKDKEGMTYLMRACKNKDYSHVSLLVEKSGNLFKKEITLDGEVCGYDFLKENIEELPFILKSLIEEYILMELMDDRSDSPSYSL